MHSRKECNRHCGLTTQNYWVPSRTQLSPFLICCQEAQGGGCHDCPPKEEEAIAASSAICLLKERSLNLHFSKDKNGLIVIEHKCNAWQCNANILSSTNQYSYTERLGNIELIKISEEPVLFFVKKESNQILCYLIRKPLRGQFDRPSFERKRWPRTRNPVIFLSSQNFQNFERK